MGMREKLIELIQSAVSGCATYWAGLIADHLIANGVTIPVRCKDCKHFGGYGACHCHAADENGTPIWVREDDFCSYGRKRDGDGNV